jgi:hypothetical protein
MSEAIKIIWERDGLKGFRRGMSARVVTFAPSTAISWLSYEFFSTSGSHVGFKLLIAWLQSHSCEITISLAIRARREGDSG